MPLFQHYTPHAVSFGKLIRDEDCSACRAECPECGEPDGRCPRSPSYPQGFEDDLADAAHLDDNDPTCDVCGAPGAEEYGVFRNTYGRDGTPLGPRKVASRWLCVEDADAEGKVAR